MHLSYRYALRPNRSQLISMAKHAGCRRFVWNYFLKQNIETYRQTKKFVFYNEMASRLPALKQEFPWLREVYSVVLQQVLKDLDKALKASFKSKKGFPKFKKKAGKTIFPLYPEC